MEKKIKSFDNIEINYDIFKAKNKNSLWLIFIHGAGGDLNAWTEERKFFHNNGYSTLAIDLRGHGKSSRPKYFKDYDLKNFAKDLKIIMDFEKILNFVIIGHCFGGMITVMFHKLFPNLAKSYILVDTTYKAPKMLNKILNSENFIIKLFNNLLEKKDVDSFKKIHADYKKYIGTGDYNISRIISDIKHTTFKSWIFTYEQISKFDAINIMNSIKQPVLIIEGEKDSVFNVLKAKKIKKLIKNSTLKIIPDANHIIILNNPDVLAEEIFKFILYYI